VIQRPQPDLEAPYHFRTLFRGERMRVGVWRCTSTDHGGAVEVSQAHSIVVPRQGAYLRHLGRQRIFADPNHVLFSNPDEEYRVTHPADAPDLCTVFVLQPGLAGELLGERPGGGAPPRFPRASAPLGSGLFVLHRLLLRLLEGQDRDALETESRILSLLARMAPPPPTSPAPSRRRTREAHRRTIEQIQTILSADPAADIGLDDLARRTHTSPFHLGRLFAAGTGIPIHRYRVRLRLRRALEYVLDTDRELSAIALDLGFASHSHFTDSFRRDFGVAPSRLRGTISAGRIRTIRALAEAGDSIDN
jgi:AraC family transcriptional regulator